MLQFKLPPAEFDAQVLKYLIEQLYRIQYHAVTSVDGDFFRV